MGASASEIHAWVLLTLEEKCVCQVRADYQQTFLQVYYTLQYQLSWNYYSYLIIGDFPGPKYSWQWNLLCNSAHSDSSCQVWGRLLCALRIWKWYVHCPCTCWRANWTYLISPDGYRQDSKKLKFQHANIPHATWNIPHLQQHTQHRIWWRFHSWFCSPHDHLCSQPRPPHERILRHAGIHLPTSFHPQLSLNISTSHLIHPLLWNWVKILRCMSGHSFCLLPWQHAILQRSWVQPLGSNCCRKCQHKNYVRSGYWGSELGAC